MTLRPAPRPRDARGFTLIETMVTIAIAGVLSSVAYPRFESQVLKARRTDALTALMAAQLAQERHRAGNAAYGALADIGASSTSPSGHYRIEVVSADAAGYELLASAVSGQARDAACRHLRLTLAEATITYSSGPDATTANPAAANRACWSR